MIATLQNANDVRTNNKYYHANGNQIAMQTGNELYYTLSDPGGSSLTLTDSNGENPAYLLYDAYGKMLSSSLRITQSALLANQNILLDVDTGLTYQTC